MSKETSLTPYEIRLKLIEMSKDFLERQYDVQRDLALCFWNEASAWAKEMKAEMPALPALSSPPTLKDIMETAQQMNAFVSQTLMPSKAK